MADISHIAARRLDRAGEVIVIVPLRRSIYIGERFVRNLELRDPKGGLSAASACEDAGGSPTDRAIAALSAMAGLSVSQILAMRTEDMTRALTFAAAAAELARED